MTTEKTTSSCQSRKQ